MDIFNKYMSNGRGYSIRGTFNDWLLQDEYVMEYDPNANTYSYTLTLQTSQWMKIASYDGKEWYGYKELAGEVDNSYITYDVGHYDIVLEPGTYLILFHAEDGSLEISRMP